jgi:hypothetical protein
VSVMPPWWSDQDDAELSVIVCALYQGVHRHREHCGECARAGSAYFCPSVDQAIGAMFDWFALRTRLSYAEWLAARRTEKTTEIAPRSRLLRKENREH